MRVLIVEDSTLTAAQVCEVVLSVHPEIKCTVVSTESEAIAAISYTSPHVVLLDLHLKLGTGFGVLRQVPKASGRPYIIVMTNFALPQYRDFALLSGADYFLDKSTSIEELPKILRSYLGAASSMISPELPAGAGDSGGMSHPR